MAVRNTLRLQRAVDSVIRRGAWGDDEVPGLPKRVTGLPLHDDVIDDIPESREANYPLGLQIVRRDRVE